MTIPPRFEWQRPTRPPRRTAAKWLLVVAALLVAFGLGVALGQALHDNSAPGGSVTFVRTLSPTGP